MTLHLLLLPRVTPPALDTMLAMCRHVHTAWCSTSRYTLAVQWLDGDRVAREKLKWKCRRGLLDLVLARYMERHATGMTDGSRFPTCHRFLI